MKKLIVDIDDLVIAMQGSFDLIDNYLDTQTGEVVIISEDFPAVSP